MKYADYRNFRRRLDAGTVQDITWSEMSSQFTVSGGPYGYREEIIKIYYCRTLLTLTGATIEEAKKIFDKLEAQITAAVGAPLPWNVKILDMVSVVAFEYVREVQP
jgi:hypothetical protein